MVCSKLLVQRESFRSTFWDVMMHPLNIVSTWTISLQQEHWSFTNSWRFPYVSFLCDSWNADRKQKGVGFDKLISAVLGSSFQILGLFENVVGIFIHSLISVEPLHQLREGKIRIDVESMKCKQMQQGQKLRGQLKALGNPHITVESSGLSPVRTISHFFSQLRHR